MTPEIPLKKQQEVLDVLAKIQLSNVTPRDWTETDLSNTIIILISVAHSLAWKNPAYYKLPFSLQSVLAGEFARNLRQSIHLFTGIDPTKNTITDDPLDADHIEETEQETK